MTTETLLDERKKELDKSIHDLKLVAIKYQEVKSKLVCNSTLNCSMVNIHAVFLKCIDNCCVATIKVCCTKQDLYVKIVINRIW